MLVRTQLHVGLDEALALDDNRAGADVFTAAALQLSKSPVADL